MSDENLWDDDNSFVDMPDEAQLDSNGQLKQSPPVRLPRPAPTPTPSNGRLVRGEPEVEAIEEELEEEVVEEDEEDFSEVLNDASLRLEQGNLYKLIMNHNLFEGIEADPKAVQNVQKEIKKFAKERMEIMLGMRRETSTVEHLEIDFPFNAVEVEVLKKLAFTATKGASENSDRYVPEVTKTTQEVERVSRKHTLNTIGNTKTSKKGTTQAKKPLNSKPSTPIKRTRLDLTIDQIALEEGIPRELLEEDISGLGGKPLHEMSEHEIMERNRIIAKRRTGQVKSSSAIPMATPEQQEMLAVSRANQVSVSTPLMSRILEAVKNMPIKN